MRSQTVDNGHVRTILEKFLTAVKASPVRHRVTLLEAVRDARGLIERLRGLGASWEEIASALRAESVEISTNTLIRYMHKIAKAKPSPGGKKPATVPKPATQDFDQIIADDEGLMALLEEYNDDTA